MRRSLLPHPSGASHIQETRHFLERRALSFPCTFPGPSFFCSSTEHAYLPPHHLDTPLLFSPITSCVVSSHISHRITPTRTSFRFPQQRRQTTSFFWSQGDMAQPRRFSHTDKSTWISSSSAGPLYPIIAPSVLDHNTIRPE